MSLSGAMGAHRGLAALGILVVLAAAGCASPPAPPTIDPQSLDRSQKEWALAVSALLTERNGGRHDLLAGYPRTSASVADTRRLLREWWGVRGRRDLLGTLHWLEEGGHRKGFEQLGASVAGLPPREWEVLLTGKRDDPDERHQLAMARTYYAKLGAKSLLGWDYARYVSLCRWGYLVGYISEEEAWGLIMPAARLLQARFESWPDLGRNYLIGREYWSRRQMRDNGHLYRATYRELVTDPESPWNRHIWYLKLD
jgi:Protein of unknown function (DUF1266)